MDERNKEEWPNASKKFFRFTDDLISINDVGEFETNYFNIYPERLELDKQNADKH